MDNEARTALEVLLEGAGDDNRRTDAVRVLRNACAGAKSVQEEILLSAGVVSKLCREIEKKCEGLKRGEDLVYVRCRLQLLHNAYVNQETMLARDKGLLMGVARTVLSAVKEDAKARDFACSVLLLMVRAMGNVDESEDFAAFLEENRLPQFLLREAPSSDFALLALTALLKNNPGMLFRSWPDLSSDEGASLASLLKEYQATSGFTLELALGTVERFKRLADGILVAVAGKSKEEPDPTELVRLLDIICELTSYTEGEGGEEEEVAHRLRGDGSLLVDTVHLLKMMNDVAKGGGDNSSVYSPVTKVAEIVEKGAEVEASPAFGMKCALVRLVGNLCWSHRRNQDAAREMEAIPLLLECSRIDAKNPFMTQWAVFAVRNLCEGNEESKAVLAGVDPKGEQVNSLQEEFGHKISIAKK